MTTRQGSRSAWPASIEHLNDKPDCRSRTLPRTMSSPLPEAARDGGWERWGIMGEELEAEEHEATRADLERRIGQAIATSRQSAFGYGNASVG